MWGPLGKVEVYGKQYPIQDCRSGVCYDGYLYYNGYIPANRINSVDRNGRPKLVLAPPAPPGVHWRQLLRRSPCELLFVS